MDRQKSILRKSVPWAIAVLLAMGAAVSIAAISGSNKDMAVIAIVGICWQTVLAASGILAIFLQINKVTKNTKAVHDWHKGMKSLDASWEHIKIKESLKAIVD